MTPLSNKHILLGVTGSIACYKSADLASKLRQYGADVDVILTHAATKFVSPLTFQSVTARRAYTDDDLWGDAGHVLHIGLAETADLMVVAPATANTIAKLARGQADNLLTVAALAMRNVVLIAPAMDGGMWAHPATQQNIKTLETWGIKIAGPVSGHLASGQLGVGRMVEPDELLGIIRKELSAGGPLGGIKVVVTAGGTQEPIDPVRVITNRSLGKQGFALAQAALDLGADVVLISAPVSLPTPPGAQRVDVRSSGEMLAAVETAVKDADVLVMAAAVADFRPADVAAQKIKKDAGMPEIQLEAAPDILAAVSKEKGKSNSLRIAVGFAAESQNLIENAQAKLSKKNLDLIVANDISAEDAGFEADRNRVTLLFADGRIDALLLQQKSSVAERVMQEIAHLLGIAQN